MAYLGKSPSQGVRNRYYFTASGGETSISGALTGGTLTFTDGNYVDVNLNGVTLVAGTDYNTSTANTIAGLSALTASDVVEIVVYDVFSVFSGNVNSDFSVGGNLSVTGTTAFTGATTITGLTTTGDINFGDNDKASFSSGKLQIYHDGTNAYIDETFANGTFLIRGNNISLQKYTGETMIQCVSDGKVELNFNNVPKLETTSSGVSVTGGVVASGGLSIDSYGDPSNNYITLRPSFAPSASGGVGFAAKDHDGANNDGLGVFGHDGISFTSGGSERMRLTSAGLLLVNTTTEGISDYGDTLTIADTGHAGMTIRSGTSSEGNVYFSDGTSGDAEYKGIVKYDHSSNAMSFWANSLSRMTINSGGQIGINGTAGQGGTRLNVEDASGNGQIRLRYNSGGNGLLLNQNTSAGAAYILHQDNSPIIFGTNNTERMRLDASGNLLVGKTSTGFGTAGGEIKSNGQITATASSAAAGQFNRLTSDGTLLNFARNNGTVGTVSVTASATTYNTTSDIRLKQDIEPLAATDKLMAMNPVSYNWKADPDGPRSMGFIAQEMQEVMPEAVSTGNDEDAMMSMDYGRITPILVSALQDAHRKIEELAAEIAALET